MDQTRKGSTDGHCVVVRFQLVGGVVASTLAAAFIMFSLLINDEVLECWQEGPGSLGRGLASLKRCRRHDLLPPHSKGLLKSL